MNNRTIDIAQYDYPLAEERIAKFPLERREESKLLVYRGADGEGVISESKFANIGSELPQGAMLVYNNTKVIRARLVFHKSTGARIEVFCLEPHNPSDYERAFAAVAVCEWRCMVGNLKRWRVESPLVIDFDIDGAQYRLTATLVGGNGGGNNDNSGYGDSCDNNGNGGEQIVRFEWDGEKTFGQMLEALGRIPIPPYLRRESDQSDALRYQTVYSKFDGSVAAPTAGLHFTEQIISSLRASGHPIEEVTLHVGAGTFLPVKSPNALDHTMHCEHFDISLAALRSIISKIGSIVAVGTTTVRTLESLAALGARVLGGGAPDEDNPVGQWEIYGKGGGVGMVGESVNAGASGSVGEGATAEAINPLSGKHLLEALASYMEREGVDRLKSSTMIMITPGYKFKVVSGIVTNFHQPCSTLLLLVSAFVGQDWHRIYDYALSNDFRFLSYGDSSLLLP